jgi:hypothetical protein
MPETFKHPLARAACLQPAVSVDGAARPMLVIVTTLELDQARKGYRKSFVDRLSHAVKEHLSRFPNVAAFVLINRVKDWPA